MLNLSRRSVLAGLAAGALLPQVAASSSSIMIASNSKALDDLLRDRIDPSMRKGHGAEVLHDGVVDPADLLRAGASGERQAQMYDVLCLDDVAMCAMTRAGLLSQITRERLPSLGQIPSGGSTSIVVVQSAYAIVYNSFHMPDPPRSLADLWSKSQQGRIGLSRSHIIANAIYAAAAEGRPLNDLGALIKAPLAWKSLGATMFSSDEALAAALSKGDVWLTVAPIADAYRWRRDGAAVAHAVPQEGTIGFQIEASVPTHARDVDKAFAYLALLIEPEFQNWLAAEQGYFPVMDPIRPHDPERHAPDTEGEIRIWTPDPAYLWTNQDDILRAWNQVFI